MELITMRTKVVAPVGMLSCGKTSLRAGYERVSVNVNRAAEHEREFADTQS